MQGMHIKRKQDRTLVNVWL